jgi:hypothetical protein
LWTNFEAHYSFVLLFVVGWVWYRRRNCHVIVAVDRDKDQSSSLDPLKGPGCIAHLGSNSVDMNVVDQKAR